MNDKYGVMKAVEQSGFSGRDIEDFIDFYFNQDLKGHKDTMVSTVRRRAYTKFNGFFIRQEVA